MRSLSRRQVRARYGQFVAEGPQSVREAVTHRPDLVRDLYLTPSAARRYADLVDRADQARLQVHEASEAVLAAMADTPSPQGLLAVCEVPEATVDDVLAAGPQLVCVLTSVRDPGNAGTVLRAADAAGADAVVISDGSVDVWSPKVVRATAGSLFHLPVVVGGTPADIVEGLRGAGIRALAADAGGRTALGDPGLDLRSPHAWVLGNEAWGLPAPLRDLCDEVVSVPIYGRAESLNLAMAATVCLYASAGVLHGVRRPATQQAPGEPAVPAPGRREGTERRAAS